MNTKHTHPAIFAGIASSFVCSLPIQAQAAQAVIPAASTPFPLIAGIAIGSAVTAGVAYTMHRRDMLRMQAQMQALQQQNAAQQETSEYKTHAKHLASNQTKELDRYEIAARQAELARLKNATMPDAKSNDYADIAQNYVDHSHVIDNLLVRAKGVAHALHERLGEDPLSDMPVIERGSYDIASHLPEIETQTATESFSEEWTDEKEDMWQTALDALEGSAVAVDVSSNMPEFSEPEQKEVVAPCACAADATCAMTQDQLDEAHISSLVYDELLKSRASQRVSEIEEEELNNQNQAQTDQNTNSFLRVIEGHKPALQYEPRHAQEM